MKVVKVILKCFYLQPKYLDENVAAKCAIKPYSIE